MKIRLILCHEESIYYADVEVPAINIGWELYVKFDNFPKATYVTVKKITVYIYDDPVTKATRALRNKDDENPEICCNVSLVYS